MSSDAPEETGRTSPWTKVTPVMASPSNASPTDKEKEFTFIDNEPADAESSEAGSPPTPAVLPSTPPIYTYSSLIFTQHELESFGFVPKPSVEERSEEDVNDEKSNIHSAKEHDQEDNQKIEGDVGQPEMGDNEDEEDKDQEKGETDEERKPFERIEEWTTPLIKHVDPELIDDESPSRLEWLRQKRENGEENVIMDEIMSMIGIEEVKSHFLRVKERVEIAKRWKEDMRNIKLDMVLHGDDGTGKRRIAQLYAEFLYSIGAVCRQNFRQEEKQFITEEDEEEHATVIFFPNAEWFDTTDDMEKTMEIVNDRKDKVVVILAYRKFNDAREASLAATSDSRWRFGNRIFIEDYGEVEIMQFLHRLQDTAGFGTKSDAETFFKIVVQAVLKVEKSEYRNATTIEKLLQQKFDEICNRKRQRLELEWVEWTKTNTPANDQDLEAIKPKDVFTIEDIVGVEPLSSRNTSRAWKELQEMVGLDPVKKEISDLHHLIDFNRRSEQHGTKGIAIPLNRFIVGAPGVGKTTIAKIYAQTLSDGGFLSEGKIIVKRASALIGEHTGDSEEKTNKALEEAKGGILIIDDAHILYKDCSDGEDTDSYRQAIIDTLAAEVSGEPDADRSVILCGYPEEMEKMVLNANKGLQRRFPWEYSIKLDSYTEDELCQILDRLMARDGVAASERGLKVARCMLSRMRTGPQFGNAAAVEALLVQAKFRRMRRLKDADVGFADMHRHNLEAEDFDIDWERWFNSNSRTRDLFQGFVGFEQISGRFQRYQKIANGMRRFGIDPKPHIPSAFVFKGPPGTGKTSAAKKVGTIFYDLGFLSSDEVVVCSVTDLVGQYTGQTGPKVRKLFNRGLGKVLFIDEAYRLNTDDSFHEDAVGEIVDIMTRPKYAGNMVVILAGYDDDMEKLLQANSGMRSRFPTVVQFTSMKPEDCLQHLIQCLAKLDIRTLDTGAGQEQRTAVLEVFDRLGETGEWANGRDVETLAQRIIGDVFVKAGEVEDGSEAFDLEVSFEEVLNHLEMILEERVSEI
ncbi:nfx1-type zinc finger-containing protein 1 protein [Fusarium austroafricanum]|uniref:Nfx1-type zinc finger-containing protein 1 protein n=1 Tax=Fusarium austroafricanum TaxID=2364996 RepID=A0A8H4P021_9HYPO|nr:nfx1-type zinc finger-containing protein 1 protein [Fusarium austroafricanum]